MSWTMCAIFQGGATSFNNIDYENIVTLYVKVLNFFLNDYEDTLASEELWPLL